MFQLWACKQVMGIAATNGLRARWTEGLDPKCPSCQRHKETCSHVLYCEEAGRVDVLLQTIRLLEHWLEEMDTDPALTHCLVKYARSRGDRSLQDICIGFPNLRQMAETQDKIGWRRFMEGMICTKLVEQQYLHLKLIGSNKTIKAWATGVVIKLLEITHGQWLYRNVVVHDATSGSMANKKKEDIQREIERQQALGMQDLHEDDQYLAEVNLGDLEDVSSERHEYWLVSTVAARKAGRLREQEIMGAVEATSENEAEGGTGEEGR